MNRQRSKSQRRGYKILQKLYDGNDGPVYLIKDLKTHKNMVLKKYEFEQTDRGIDPVVLMEATILNLIKGEKNLVQMHKIEKNQGVIDIYMEKMDGEVVELILAEPNPAQIKNYLKQMLNGLVFLHKNGIIHNDIKPKNILYRNKGGGKFEIKIIDFGLAYLINFPYYRARDIQITHHYTPPEYFDHREVGRVSVNSDIFSLGIIFYYLINPEDYRETDYNRNYDYIFDPNQIDWKIVISKIGKKGANLLEQMMELDPEKRITSLRALEHEYLKNVQAGSSWQGVGGGDRRWEIPNLMSRNEFMNRRNQEEFLELIVEKSRATKIKVNPKQSIPIHIWNVMYDLFEDLKLKFVTLNYAIYLMLKFLTHRRIRQDKAEHLAFACLFLSSKLNEFKVELKLRRYKSDVRKSILKFEKEIIEVMEWKFPIPLTLTKEVILYDTFLQIIYKNKYIDPDVEIVANLYNIYYMLELLSSIIYFSTKLSDVKKEDLVMAILAFRFPKIPHSSRVKQGIIDLLKSKPQIFWIERSLLKYWNIE